MKTLVYVALLIVALPSFAITVFGPIPEKPNFENLAQFIHNKKDYRPTITITQEVFAKYALSAKFLNASPDDIYKSKDYPYDSKLGQFEGAFSLKNGELFLWSMPRKNVIEIKNSRGQTGWLILEKDISVEEK